MSGELQTIPARHGVATFVPRGRTIKIINTYGKQVVSTWAFGLHAPPEENEDEKEQDEEDIEEKTKELKDELNENEDVGRADKDNLGKSKDNTEEDYPSSSGGVEQAKGPSSNDDDPLEQAPDTPENEKTTETTQEKKSEKRTWSSYLPSIPYRNRGAAAPAPEQSQKESEAEKAQNEADSKKWSSYLPTGKSFSSYVPNVQLPDSKGVVSAFQTSHYRDPNKSYAEQLYDFSKTPVGAGSIAAATGSGTASSLYAAYNAYTKMNPNKSDQPPMEYLSLPHTRASTRRLVPEVDDTLLTNLRNPIMTLVEDTTSGAHDTLTAACDASLYAALGVEKPEEHGSCAVNLVLALKELNEKAGLKGTKAIGADITVNIAPTPLHLFMNAPIQLEQNDQGDSSGAKGATLKVEEPSSKKRSFVRFRAERDIVIVMSACPMEVGKQNGGRCMAANFMVEENSEETPSSSTSTIKKAKPRKINSKKEEPKDQDAEKPKPMPAPRGGPAKFSNVKGYAARRDSAAEDSNSASKTTSKTDSKDGAEEALKPKKKPKKLERRTGAGAAPAKGESS